MYKLLVQMKQEHPDAAADQISAKFEWGKRTSNRRRCVMACPKIGVRDWVSRGSAAKNSPVLRSSSVNAGGSWDKDETKNRDKELCRIAQSGRCRGAYMGEDAGHELHHLPVHHVTYLLQKPLFALKPKPATINSVSLRSVSSTKSHKWHSL